MGGDGDFAVGGAATRVHDGEVFATYVHQIDPVIFEVSNAIALRWYGLAYLAGFVAGYYLLKWLADRDLWVMRGEKVADFIAAAALFGVFLGGRLGYVFFYQVPRDGWDSVLKDPLVVLRVWEGGMASHGALLGLAIFTLVYAMKNKVAWGAVADGLVVVGPLGVFFGRLANFINGELYGRVVSNLPWAVKFPSAFIDPKAPESARFEEALAAAEAADPALAAVLEKMNVVGGTGSYYEVLIDANRKSDLVTEAIAPYLEERHPSQLYQAFLEGLLVFVILWVVRVRFPKAPHGFLTGLFLFLYATMRIVGERFRQPDAAWVIEEVMTMGQFLSLFMYVVAAVFFWMAWKGRGARAVLPPVA